MNRRQHPPYRDVSGDDHISALDALLVINYLNSHPLDSDGSQASQVLAARQAFADEYGVKLEDVLVVNVESVTWSDSSLGCPRPGGYYLMATVPGHRVTLRIADVEAIYHTGSWGLTPWVVRYDTGNCQEIPIPMMNDLAMQNLLPQRASIDDDFLSLLALSMLEHSAVGSNS